MYYVLFTYSKGRKERDFRRFRFDDDVIQFLHENYEKIDIVQIIVAEKIYRLGLIETEDLIKSVLEQTEEEAVNNLKKTLETDLPSPEEKSAMSKIADDIEKEQKDDKNVSIGPSAGKGLSDEEIMRKNKAALERADKVIEAAKKDKKVEKFDKSNWKDCPTCGVEKVAPWSKKGICSICQRSKKKLIVKNK